MSKIINVVSGKGGTGKTLLSAVLAEMLSKAGATVLVIDLDIFVRGLTALLYYQENGSIQIVDANDLSVSDFFKAKGEVSPNRQVSISRYRSFDVFPSVSIVDEILNFKDMMPNNLEEANKILNSIFKHVGKDYDYIFLDSRAGYDELIAAAHQLSDFSLCVEEDDNISKITSDNLVSQLRKDSTKSVLRVRNKVRDIKATNSSETAGVAFVGSIPFDADVMNNFGEESFWSQIGKSIYKDALTNVWNSLAKKMRLPYKLESNRIGPVPTKSVEKKLTKLSTINRIIFMYGILITLFSIFALFSGREFFTNLIKDPIRLIALFSSIVGIGLTVISVINNRK